MNTAPRYFFLLVISLFGLASAQAQQKTPTQIRFDELHDYLTNDKRRPGDRIVVTDVPLNAGSKKHQQGLVIVEAGSDDDNTQFFTSSSLAKRLGARVRSGNARVRLTCTVIELRGEFDVSLSAFVTKIEALRDDGSIAWVENGTPPSRTKYRI